MFNKRILYLPNIDFSNYVKVHTLAVAGGGGGGAIIGGGGGAGGYISSSILFEPDLTHTVIVGAGGVGSIGYNNTPDNTNGTQTSVSASAYTYEPWTRWFSGSSNEYSPTSSSFGDIIVHGGGLGSSWSNTVKIAKDNPGGCGGGGSCHTNGTESPSGGPIIHPLQGHVGGKASAHSDLALGDGGGGGGGGVNEPGYDAPSIAVGGNGGTGLTTKIEGSVFNFGGGGGGGTRDSTGANYSNNGTKGGQYGGGRGGYRSVGVGSSGGATSGTANTGGGGGCGGYHQSYNSQQGGSGGSGIVIFRVPTSKYSTSTGSPTITTVGSDTVIKFTSSGTITFTQ